MYVGDCHFVSGICAIFLTITLHSVCINVTFELEQAAGAEAHAKNVPPDVP